MPRRGAGRAALLALCLGAPCGAGAVADTLLAFTLPRAATTSAGVYDRQGRLVRTLWRAEPMGAGPQQLRWDGRDDRGQPVAAQEHEVLLIHHRIGYVWEGVIGNRSARYTGAGVHKAFQPPTSIALAAGRGWYTVGYNEMQPGLHGFDPAAPGEAVRPLRSTDPFAAFTMVAVDDARLYWSNGGGLSKTSFVGAFELRSAQPLIFRAGQALCLNRRPASPRCYEDQDYPSVIDVETAAPDAPTGLAVQRNGRVLAVAHGGRGQVRLFDKFGGARIGEIALTLAPRALNQLAMTPGGDLWVVSGRSLLRYTDLDRTRRLVARIDGLERPLAIAADPRDDGALWVADGAPSRQLKRYGGDGQLTATLGAAGGHDGDPAVRTDKLCFALRPDQEQTALAVSEQGDVWVVDTCNNRVLRLRDAGPAASDADVPIAYLPAFYAATADHGDPRRVFANFLEFDVDAARPLEPGRSGVLVRNWLAGLPAALADERARNGGFGGFTSVETLANGRTYGIVAARGRQVVVELPASGPLRVVRMLATPAPGMTPRVLYENGELGHALTGSARQTVLRLPLRGFDAAGDPVWSDEPEALAAVPLRPGTPYHRGAFSGMPPRFPLTGSGRVVFFDPAVQGNEGFHLGAAARGGQDWLWLASPSGALDGKGSFQTKAVDGSVHYGGNAVWTAGRHIVYGYHGEFHRDLDNGRIGQANQFMHFDDSGLFIGQFGRRTTRSSGPADEGVAGNAFAPTLLRAGPRLYLLHNDESAHGGLHRWRIDGWDDVQELRGRGPVGGTIVLR